MYPIGKPPKKFCVRPVPNGIPICLSIVEKLALLKNHSIKCVTKSIKNWQESGKKTWIKNRPIWNGHECWLMQKDR